MFESRQVLQLRFQDQLASERQLREIVGEIIELQNATVFAPIEVNIRIETEVKVNSRRGFGSARRRRLCWQTSGVRINGLLVGKTLITG